MIPLRERRLARLYQRAWFSALIEPYVIKL
jgi:hypothetical protein